MDGGTRQRTHSKIGVDMSSTTWETTSVTLWSRFWSSLIPNYMKRIMVLASLYRVLSTDNLQDQCDMEVLNNRLDLADDHHATKLPALLFGSVWKDLNRHDIPEVTDSEAIGLWARQVAAKTPYALRYDCLDTIASDIVEVGFVVSKS